MPVYASYSSEMVTNADRMVEGWTLRHLNPYCTTLEATGEAGVYPVKRTADLVDATTRCRAVGCWDAFEAEYESGPALDPPDMSWSPTAGDAFERLCAELDQVARHRPFTPGDVAGRHKIYVLGAGGDCQVVRRLTGYKPPRPECYIGETNEPDWRDRVDRHTRLARTGTNHREFLVELVRQRHPIHAHVIESGHTLPTARAAEAVFYNIAKGLGWTPEGGHCHLGRWLGAPAPALAGSDS